MTPRVVIVAQSASARFGGEATLPLHYYRILRRRGVAAWLVVHERTKEELSSYFGADDHIVYVPDTKWHRLAWRWSRFLPDRVAGFTLGMTMRLLTQVAQKRVIRRLLRDDGANIVHQPTPVSPKEPSLMYGLGVPVVFGPMNGGMNFPPAFRHMQGKLEALTMGVGRAFSSFVNRLLPGKRHAAVLLVANRRTAEALPASVSRHVVELVENGVDLSLWTDTEAEPHRPAPSPARFVFMGRLVDWKAVDLLLQAFAIAAAQLPMTLLIAGDGAERSALESLARSLGILGKVPDEIGKVYFAGWRSQQECSGILRDSDALVLPSLYECGGAVILESMAMGRPVIATNWGGPADYLDETCGILVEPASRQSLIDGLTAGMVRLSIFPNERRSMGTCARTKIVQQYDWEIKVDRMLEIYQQALQQSSQALRK
jgi:glycosyltransferase involved in cell wall biosynthesis